MQPISNKISQQLRRAVVDRTTPYYAIIKSVDNVREVLSTDDDSKETDIRHPYVSAGSWIRTMPSSGVRIVVAYSKDNRKLEVIGYQNNRAQELSTGYAQRQNLFRTLREGEHEVMSSGKASSFWGSQPFKVDRAGAVSHKLDGIKLESATRAPTMIWRGARNRPDVIGHEVRIGAVKRSTSAAKEVYALKIGSLPDIGQAIYGNEFLIALNADLTDAPLIDIRSGDVFDDSLTPGYPMAIPRLGDNVFPLRHHAKYFVTIEPGSTPVPMQFTDVQIDSLGNVNVNLSKLSVMGLTVKVPLGRVLLSCGLDMTLDAKLGIKLTSLGKITLDAKLGIDLITPASVTISGDVGVQVKSKGPTSIAATANVEINGKAGVKLIGAMGETGRPIATLNLDPVTSVPLFLDPTLST